jgi:phospholipid methyltransferase
MVATPSSSNPPPGLWFGQWIHVVGLGGILLFGWSAWVKMERPWATAFWVSMGIPVAHQIYVWLAWRIELRSGATSRMLGFGGYQRVFFVLFGGRFVSLVVLAWLDHGSMPLPTPVYFLLTTALAAVGIYAMYSVVRYFGLARAAGADHFEQRYWELPLVKQGIFKYTDNGMYLYAFFLFWLIAVGFESAAALLVAGCSHAYIWVHFYATEKPDMKYLFGNGNGRFE